MKSRIITVWILSIFIVLWRVLTWWSLTGLGGGHVGTQVLGVMGLSILVIGLITYRKTKSMLSFVFLLYCSAMAFHWGGYPLTSDGTSIPTVTAIYSFLSIFLGSTILHFSVLYPRPKKISLGKLAAIYSPAILGVISILGSVFNLSLLELFIGLEPLIVTIFALMGAILLFRTYFRTPSNERKLIGANIVYVGIIVANFPYLLSEFMPSMNFGNGLGFLLYRLLFVLQPIAFAVAVRKAEIVASMSDPTLVGK